MINIHQRITRKKNRVYSAVHMTNSLHSDKSPYFTCSLLSSDQQYLWVHQHYIHGVIFILLLIIDASFLVLLESASE